MATATELVTKFVFQGSTQPLTNFNNSLTDTISIAKTSALALAGAGAGMFAFVSSQIDAIDVLADLSNETGVAIENIQKLGYVAQLSGSSAEAIQGTISALTTKIGLASRGGENEVKKLSKEFNQLGISVKDSQGGLKTADTLLFDIQESFSKMDLSVQEKSAFLTRLGIDKSAIQMLSLTTEEMTKLTKEAETFGIVTQAQAEQAQSVNDNLDRMKMATSSVSKQIAISFAPQMLSITDGFMKFLGANQKLISNGLSKVFEIIGSVIGAIVNTITTIFKVIDVMFGWENVLTVLSVAWLILNRAMLMNPIALIVAGIVAVILIIDDLVTAFEGGQSAIRDFFLEWFGWDILPSLKAFVAGFMESASWIKDSLADIRNYAGQVWDSIVVGITKAFSILPSVFKTVWEGIVGFFKFDWLVSGIYSLVNNMLKLFQPVVDLYNKVSSSIGGATITMPVLKQDVKATTVPQTTLTNPTNTKPNQSITNGGNSLKQDIKIDIKTNDAKTVAPAIGKELNKYMADSKTQFASGGK